MEITHVSVFTLWECAGERSSATPIPPPCASYLGPGGNRLGRALVLVVPTRYITKFGQRASNWHCTPPLGERLPMNRPMNDPDASFRPRTPRLAAMTEAARAAHGRAEREHAGRVYLALGLDPTFDPGVFDALLDGAAQ